MDKKKILIWDDQEADAAHIKGLVETAKQVHAWPLTIDVRLEKFESFLDHLRNNHANYHLLIIDCLEGDNEVVSQALDALAGLNSDLKVVAVTVDSKKMGSQFTSLKTRYNKCRSVYKACLYDPSDDESCENVLSETLALKKTKQGITKDIKLTIEPDIYLEYIIESLGGIDVLKQLMLELKKVLKLDVAVNVFEIEALSQGLSGAIVLKLIIKDDAGNNSNWFIKISRDRESLELEIDKVMKEFDAIPPKYRLAYKISMPISINDILFVLVAELAIGSSSIRQTILKDNSGARSVKIIRELMTDCMTPFYKKKKAITEKTQIVNDILSVFETRRLSFLKKSIKELKVLTGNCNIIEAILKYQKSSKLGEIFFSKENLKKILVHGDFHGNNILIVNKKDIIIIDPANIKPDHWSRDICMFIVDLFAHGIDADSKEYFGISNIKKWKSLGSKILNNRKIANNGKNKGVIATINWLTNIDNLRNIFSNYFELWEFQLSLGVEFLKISYKQDQLPAGKRAACLLIGNEALKIAKKTYISVNKKSKK